MLQNYVLTPTHSNNIFISKHDTLGNLLWVESDGSDNSVSARNITVDVNDNVYIIGNFECTFTDYSDDYGSGTFNSIGYQVYFHDKI